jgi:hypothetical protein
MSRCFSHICGLVQTDIYRELLSFASVLS